MGKKLRNYITEDLDAIAKAVEDDPKMHEAVREFRKRHALTAEDYYRQMTI